MTDLVPNVVMTQAAVEDGHLHDLSGTTVYRVPLMGGTPSIAGEAGVVDFAVENAILYYASRLSTIVREPVGDSKGRQEPK